MPFLSSHLSKFCSKSPHFFHFSEKTSRPSRQKGSPFAENSASPFAHFFTVLAWAKAQASASRSEQGLQSAAHAEYNGLPFRLKRRWSRPSPCPAVLAPQAPRAQSAAWFQGFRHRRAQCSRRPSSTALCFQGSSNPGWPRVRADWLCPARPARAAWLAAARCRAQAVCFRLSHGRYRSKPDW